MNGHDEDVARPRRLRRPAPRPKLPRPFRPRPAAVSTPPTPPQAAPAEQDRRPMTGWFDPGQLVRTGTDVVISAMCARNSDRRVLDALSQPGLDQCDYSSRDELWLDYVADTGDG